MNLNSILDSMERLHIKKFLIVLMLQMEKRMVSLLMVKVDTQVHLFISMQLGELTKKISKIVMLKSLMVLQLL